MCKHFNYVHGHGSDENRSRTYRTWEGIKRRCNSPNHPQYHRYGGRGIYYDISWENFENFLSDMGERPEGKTLDRINTNGNYNKENCRWATTQEQQQNLSIKTTPHKDSKSGVVGVCFLVRDNKWVAYCRRNGISKYLYRGDSFADACSARQQWETNSSSI